MTTFAAQLLNGVQYGLLLFLISSGLTLIFGVMGLINLAHGSLFMIGAYIAFTVSAATGSLWVALPVAIGAGILLGGVLERVLFRRFYRREHLDQVLLTFALILLFEEGRSILVGNDFHGVPVPASLDVSVPMVGGFGYSAYRLVVLGVCLLVALAMFLLLERTRLGSAVRAAAEKPEMVELLGIDARFIHVAVFATGTALAMLAGALAAPLQSVYPGMGNAFLIVSFVVVGVVDTLAKAYLPLASGLAIYAVMAAILIWRPSGLFAPAARRA